MDYLPHFLKYYNLDLLPSNSEVIEIESAKNLLYPGAHIATTNLYEHVHHGIVIDPNEPDILIIHFWGPDKNHSLIQTTTLPIFLAGGIERIGKRNRHLYLINYENDTVEKQQKTVEIAKEMLEKADKIEYDLASSNCESFAYFCRTGKWESHQVTKIKDLLIMKASEIYEQIKDADDKNRKNINSILNSIPTDALNPTEKALYDQFRQD